MDAYFGVVLEINGKEIALEPKTAINKIKELGLEAQLPPGTEVHLGSIANGLEGFVQGIDPNFKLPPKEDLPLPALQKAYETLRSAELTINELYLKIPPKPATGDAPPTTYRLGVYIGWPASVSLIGESLKLKGFSLKIASTESGTLITEGDKQKKAAGK